MTAPRYLDKKQAAAYLNVSERYVKRLIDERRVPFSKLGPHKQSHVRIDVRDLERLVTAGRVEPRT